MKRSFLVPNDLKICDINFVLILNLNMNLEGIHVFQQILSVKFVLNHFKQSILRRLPSNNFIRQFSNLLEKQYLSRIIFGTFIVNLTLIRDNSEMI